MRLHDKIYLKENRYLKPKDSFKFLVKILKKQTTKKEYSILDLGCSNGELIYQLEKHFKNFKITGYDIRQDLLNKAKKNLPKSVILKKINVNTKIKTIDKFDIIICSGVISIFDNLDKFHKNIKKLIKPNGKIYLFGNFNNYDYNIFVTYEDIKLHKNIRQTGWNIWSIKTIKEIFKVKKIKQYPFFIKKNIKKKNNDLIRSWTIKIGGRRFFTNALMFIQNQMWIEIS
jgi:SAM-dependent methyltransferase